MTTVLDRHSIRPPKAELFSWKVAGAIILLLTIGVLISLLAGSGSLPEELAGTWMGAP